MLIVCGGDRGFLVCLIYGPASGPKPGRAQTQPCWDEHKEPRPSLETGAGAAELGPPMKQAFAPRSPEVPPAHSPPPLGLPGSPGEPEAWRPLG